MMASSQPATQSSDSSMFKEVIPWEHPVNGEQLLDELTQFIQRYVVCEQYTAVTASIWIAFTWFIDAVTIAPIANITAPLPNCGKSTLLDLMEQLVRKPIKVDNVSPAALFRTIEKWGPTLLIDEVDSFLSSHDDARGILNSGHKRNGAVLRLVGTSHDPKRFTTWGAKVLCGIGSIASTLESRSIRLELRRKLPGEIVENLRHADPKEIERLSRQLARFSQDAHEMVKAARPTPITTLNNRAQYNWEPLLAISEATGGKWTNLIRNAALAISEINNADDMVDINTELLRDIREVFGNTDKIFTANLIAGLCNLEEAPWSIFNRGKAITSRQLSKRLQSFGIKPVDIRIIETVRKGYRIDKFQDAFLRYLPNKGNADATPLQAADNAGMKYFPSATPVCV